MAHRGQWCFLTICVRPDVAGVVQLLEDVEWLRVVPWRLGVTPSVVSRLWRRYRGTGECTRRQGQCCSRMITPLQARILILLSRRNHMSTSKALEIDFRRATEMHLPDQTV